MLALSLIMQLYLDGHTWFVQRKATSKIFNGNAFRGIISTSLDSNLAKLHAIIKRHADKGESQWSCSGSSQPELS